MNYHDVIRKLRDERLLSVQDLDRVRSLFELDEIPTDRFERMVSWLESKPYGYVAKPSLPWSSSDANPLEDMKAWTKKAKDQGIHLGYNYSIQADLAMPIINDPKKFIYGNLT